MKKILCTIVLALSILLIFTINFKVNASGLRLDLGNNINSINNNANYKWDEITPNTSDSRLDLGNDINSIDNNENYKWDETTPPKKTDPWDTYLDRSTGINFFKAIYGLIGFFINFIILLIIISTLCLIALFIMPIIIICKSKKTLTKIQQITEIPKTIPYSFISAFLCSCIFFIIINLIIFAQDNNFMLIISAILFSTATLLFTIIYIYSNIWKAAVLAKIFKKENDKKFLIIMSIVLNLVSFILAIGILLIPIISPILFSIFSFLGNGTLLQILLNNKKQQNTNK